MYIKGITLAAMLSALLLSAPGAFAQQYGPSSQSASASVDQATIGKFASALGMVQSIQQETSQKLQAVEDNAEARALQTKAQEDMLKAVEANGLTVQEYNDLATRIQQDQGLHEEVMQRLGYR